MKNDLTQFEKNLLKSINLFNGTKFTYKHLMEWNTSEDALKSNLKEGEVMYEALGCYVAIKPTQSN